MSRRTEMIASTIQKELAEMIMRDLQDPRLTGFPSITRVKVSPDLAIADVYVTIMGTAGQQQAALNALKHSAGLMRAKLTRAMSLRQSPFLKFHIDEHLKKELAVLELINKARKEDEELARKRAGLEPLDPLAEYEQAVPDSAESVPEVDQVVPGSGENIPEE